jgi:hypothetical protein
MFSAKFVFHQHGLAKKKLAPQYLLQTKNIDQHGLAKKKCALSMRRKNNISPGANPPPPPTQHLMVHPLYKKVSFSE